MEYMSPIIILGPSTIGKSTIARTFATAINAQFITSDKYYAHIITSDKYYLYASSNFMLGIGLTPDDMQEQPLLFGSLSPEDPLPSSEAYIEMAEKKVDEIRTLGHMAIIEGCSVEYGRALVEKFGAIRSMHLTWPERYPVSLAIEVDRAYQKLLDLGLYSETERNLDLGFGDTYPMGSLIYKPTVMALRGKITRQQADEMVVTKWIDEAIRVNQEFAQMAQQVLNSLRPRVAKPNDKGL